MAVIRYVKVANGYLAKKAGDSPDKDTNKKILLGARLHVKAPQFTAIKGASRLGLWL